MKMLIPILCMFLCLTACKSPVKFPIVEQTSVPAFPTPSNSNLQANWFDTAFESGILEEYRQEGIDLVGIVEAYVDNCSDIVSVQCHKTPCNFSRDNSSYTGDSVLKINVEKSWWKLSRNITCVLIVQENGYQPIWTQRHNYSSAEAKDLTGDGRAELIFEYDDSGNGYTRIPFQIYRFNTDTRQMDCILDEMACDYLPYKRIEGHEFWTVCYQNEFEYLPVSNGASDIIMNYQITDTAGHEYASDSMPFTFDGQKFQASSYFDYRSFAQSIYDKYPAIPPSR